MPGIGEELGRLFNDIHGIICDDCEYKIAAQSGETPAQQLKAAISIVRQAATNNDDVSAVAFSRFNNVLLTIEQRAAV